MDGTLSDGTWFGILMVGSDIFLGGGSGSGHSQPRSATLERALHCTKHDPLVQKYRSNNICYFKLIQYCYQILSINLNNVEMS